MNILKEKVKKGLTLALPIIGLLIVISFDAILSVRGLAGVLGGCLIGCTIKPAVNVITSKE